MTEILVDTAPFDLGARDARAAALCLHGLTGTPYEVRPLGEALASAGIRAVGPTLPGHDRAAEVLATLAYTHWLEAMRARLHELQAEHERVFLVGLSLGGLLSLCLAAEERVDGLAVIGTPLRFRPVVRWAIPWLKVAMPMLKKGDGSDIRDAAARARHPSLPVMPLASIQQLLPLQARVAAGLARIEEPILVAHGAHDTTADPGDARRIHEGVASEVRELLLLPDSGHVVPVDRDGARLAEAVVKHLHPHL